MGKDVTLRVAAKALIINGDDQVLIVREATTYGDGTQIGRFGLPGGRIEVGEAFYDGLAREVKEEVGLTIEPLYPLHVGEWRPVIKGVPHQIIALFMACKTVSTKVRLSNEHDHYEWIDPARHAAYDIMEPDNHVIDAYLALR